MDFLKYTVADAMLEEAKKKNFNYKTFDLVKKMPSNKLTNYAFQNNHDLSFKNVTKSWGLDLPTVSNGAAYSDLDNDGDLDLIVCNNNEPVLLYRNNAEKAKNNYLNLDLKGVSKNTEALGAKASLMQMAKFNFSKRTGYAVFKVQSLPCYILDWEMH